MPTVKTYTVYQFSELSDSAKESARNWYRSVSDFEFYAETVIADAKDIAHMFGLTIDNISYSGFCSQGDGACFEASYKYKKGGLKDVKSFAPMDDTLHKIVKNFQEIQRKNFYSLTASTKHHGRYFHAQSMDIYVDTTKYNSNVSENDSDYLTACLQDFAHWIYKQLENEYEYSNSEEQVDESIEANEYEFDEKGKIA